MEFCYVYQCSFENWTIQPLFIIEYSGDLKSNHLKSGLFEGWISIGPVFKWLGFSYGYIYSPNYLKTRPFKIRMFLAGFQMTFDKMTAICLDLK